MQIQKAGLAEMIAQALQSSGLPARRLELEVTETVILAGAESVNVLSSLHVSGVGIVLGDFGTGYASLSTLVSLPFSKIKIDRSFVSNLLSQQSCRAIVAAIMGLARGLEMDVTAEGGWRPRSNSRSSRLQAAPMSRVSISRARCRRASSCSMGRSLKRPAAASPNGFIKEDNYVCRAVPIRRAEHQLAI